jgi:hypothetical protein
VSCPPSPPSKIMYALYLQECRFGQSNASGEPVWACSRLRKAAAIAWVSGQAEVASRGHGGPAGPGASALGGAGAKEFIFWLK